MNQSTQNYVVFGVVVAAFAVILPLFMRPYFSSPQPSTAGGAGSSIPRGQGMPAGGSPHSRNPMRGGAHDMPGMPGGRPHMGAPPPPAGDHGMDKGGSGGRGGIMSIALPIYSIGIVLYVLYVFYKFYTKGFTPIDKKSGNTGRGNKKPSAEQIQNYRQFLLAKEECARQIDEERRTGSGKMSKEQLEGLEERLKEAEEAMERAMENMGLNISMMKQETNYKDPLTESLDELKKTMANLAANASPPSAPAAPAKDASMQFKKCNEENEKAMNESNNAQSNGGSNLLSATSGCDNDVLQGGSGPDGVEKKRRVSFAEGCNLIDTEKLAKTIGGEVGDDHAEVDVKHPPTEPEGIYLHKQPEDVPSSPTVDIAAPQQSSDESTNSDS